MSAERTEGDVREMLPAATIFHVEVAIAAGDLVLAQFPDTASLRSPSLKAIRDFDEAASQADARWAQLRRTTIDPALHCLRNMEKHVKLEGALRIRISVEQA